MRKRTRRLAAIAALALLCAPAAAVLAAALVKAGHYSGHNQSVVGGAEKYPITFRVSSDGKKITSIKFAIFIACGPPGSDPFKTVHNVAISNGKFKFTSRYGAYTTTVTGTFLAHRKAKGSISATVNIPTLCKVTGHTAWKAKA
jgi:hypothetical protein